MLLLQWLSVQEWLEDNHNLGFLQTGQQGGERTIGLRPHDLAQRLEDLHNHFPSPPRHQVPVMVVDGYGDHQSNLIAIHIEHVEHLAEVVLRLAITEEVEENQHCGHG